MGIAEHLIGRDVELGRIDEFVRTMTGQGAALVLNGDPGVGKTALLSAATDLAAGIGAEVLRAEGTQFEANISFAALNQLLRPRMGKVNELSASHRMALSVALGLADSPPPQPLVLVSAVLALLGSDGSRRPIFVAVDDLHWVDRASAGVLALLCRRLVGSRIGFLGTTRTGWQSHFDVSGLPHLDVQRLTDEASNQLVMETSPSLGPYARRRVVNEACGNPLALLEFPQTLSEPESWGKAGLPLNLPLTSRLQQLFRERVAQLPPATRRLLLLASLDGSGSLATVQEIAGESTLQELTPAEQEGLIRIDTHAGEISFRHPLIGSTLIDGSLSLDRQEAHRALAQHMEHDLVRKAWHLAEATIGTDDEVARLLETAAHQVLSRGDALQAIDMLMRAAGFSCTSSDRSRRLADASFVSVIRTDEVIDHRQLMKDARDASGDRDTALLMASAAGFTLLFDSDATVDTAHDIVRKAIDAHPGAEKRLDESLKSALGVLAVISYNGMRPDLWAPFHKITRDLVNLPIELSLVQNFWADPRGARRQP